MKNILTYFPLQTPRSEQVKALNAIKNAIKAGYKNIILEAPVGSGKSAIAVTVAKYLGESHILTPRKSLQDQYYDDFKAQGLVLMKGRDSYECTLSEGFTCKEGPCLSNREIKREYCTSPSGASLCPYDVAMIQAQDNDHVVHNFHSFIFQAFYAERFDQKKLLVIDEAHMVENTVRDFASKEFTIQDVVFKEEELPTKVELPLLSNWVEWLTVFSEKYSDRMDKLGESPRSRYLAGLERLDSISDKVNDGFVIKLSPDRVSKTLKVTLIPDYIGELAQRLLFDFGETRLIMSGTIYDYTKFCATLGLKDSETCYYTMPSEFPKENRPIHLKEKYMLDLSFAKWNENYKDLIRVIQEVCAVYHDVKGLIHTPSYEANRALFNSLRKDPRFITHERENFNEALQKFYSLPGPKVFLSPICQQGVDFKYDRARFQIILRVPYLNRNDAFIGEKAEKDRRWYNLQSLITFGQQTGRIVRAGDDLGDTILIDSRFTDFLRRNNSLLPTWFKEAIKK